MVLRASDRGEQARPLSTGRAWRWALAGVPGLALATAIALLATLAGRVVPVVGAPVIAVVTGLGLAAVGLPDALRPGLGLAGRRVLQGAIVLLGFELSLRQVLHTGVSSLPVLGGTLLAGLGAAALVGPRLGLRRDVTTLIGVGTAICGASAIAATEAVIGAEEADVAYAIATIFTFNIVAVVSYPALGHLMGLSQHAFGLWAGTAVNDTSSVVAAASNYGHAATSYAVVVKLTRTLAIVPISAALAWWRSREGSGERAGQVARARPTAALRRAVPGFIVAFVLAVSVDSSGAVPASWHPGLSGISTFLVTVALAGIGCSARFGEMRRAGARPLLLGAALWAVVCLTSLGLQAATGTL